MLIYVFFMLIMCLSLEATHGVWFNELLLYGVFRPEIVLQALQQVLWEMARSQSLVH